MNAEPKQIDLSTLQVLPPSLRHAVVTLVAGKVGAELYKLTGNRMIEYAKRIGADFRIIHDSADSPYPLAYKFKLRKLLDQWERIIFLDADVIITPDAPNLFDEVPESHAGIHEDYPHLDRRDWLEREYYGLCKQMNWPIIEPNTCLNTGVMVLSAAHREMFERPPRPFIPSHTTEQSLINLNIARNGIPVHHLPLRLSWLWFIDEQMQRIDQASIHHFAKPRGASDARRLKLIRKRLGIAEPKPKPQRGPCLYLGKRTEFRPGCGGKNCVHDCDHPQPELRQLHPQAVPGDNCQSCNDWVQD